MDNSDKNNLKYDLTLEMLNRGKPFEILCKGEIEDSVSGFHLNRTGKIIKWVAIRGFVNDWCIYTESCYKNMTYQEICTNGDKILSSTAKKVINADKEVWGRYRD